MSNQMTKLLVLLTITCYSQQSHPHYTYVCKENGDVEFAGFKTGSTVSFASRSCNDKTASPTKNRNGTVVTIPSACMGDNISAKRSVTVKVNDLNLNEPSPSPDQGNKVVGGNVAHQFKLICDPIPTEGVLKTALERLNIKDTEVVPTKTDEVSSVEMRIKAVDEFSTPDISELYIGDDFYVFLKYTGTRNYLLEPNKCTAYAGNDIILSDSGTNTKQVLWTKPNDKSNFCVDSTAKQYRLVDDKGFRYDGTTGQLVRIKLHAFHFQGNNDITIACEVLMMPHINDVTDDGNVCPNVTGQGKKRKRRSINLQQTTEDVKQTLTVQDRDYTGNGCGNINPTYQLMCGAVMVLILKWSQ